MKRVRKSGRTKGQREKPRYTVKGQILRNRFLRQRAKVQGKIVVVFFCWGGAERSYIAKQEFKLFLKKIHLSKKSYVSHFAWGNINHNLVRSVARFADFVVPIGADSRHALSEAVKSMRIKPVLLKPDFKRRGGMLNVANYGQVLRPIAEARPELGIKLKKNSEPK